MSKSPSTKRSQTGRKRGGASVPCPSCGGASKVVETRRALRFKLVARARECLSCDRVFYTSERVVKEMRL
jgi:transcriptional regulator NrdR family protein